MNHKRSLARLIHDRQGAVAPTVALAMFGLIAVGGVAWDYARLVTLDSELQGAADQAALAAATQLDGKAAVTGGANGARTRATDAASNLVTNYTRLANEAGSSPQITIASVSFYQDKAKTVAATNDANAHFVQVTVTSRRGHYAMTPIVAAVSPTINASATAGLGSAVCKVPPVMMCNPQETADPDFTTGNYVGKGLRLVANGGSGAYAPGNFGFLDVGAGNGAQALSQELGRLFNAVDCTPADSVTTEPGSMVSVMDALNTRFDIYANGLNNACGATGASCPPSANVRKDVLNPWNEAGNGNGNGGGNGNGNGNNNGNGNGNNNGNGGGNGGGGGSGSPSCAFSTGNGGQGWQLPAANRYLPTSAAPVSDLTPLAPMGYPRDMCHAISSTGSCAGGRVGDGAWDRAAYFRSNQGDYPTVTNTATANAFMTSTFGTTTPTRYQVYQYEGVAANNRLAKQTIPGGNTLYSYGAPICMAPGIPTGNSATATAPNGSTVSVVDRRVLSVAVVNCTAGSLNGRTTGVRIQKWVDIFLVEPSLNRDRTSAGDIYVEVIGTTGAAGGPTQTQIVRRDTPYLID